MSAVKNVKKYTGTMPADPCEMDLSVHRVPSQNVYSVLPFTVRGYTFLVDHIGMGSAHGDVLLVPGSSIVAFCDSVFDEGLKVV